MESKLTPEKLTAFCAALAETCNVGKACAAVGISRYTAYKWRKDMPDFAVEWDDAMKAGLLGLEDEAHRRAFDGVDEPLTHKGQFTYLHEEVDVGDGKIEVRLKRDANGQPIPATMKKYSDTLAIFLLKAHDPDKYRDNSKLELTGSLDLRKLSDDEIETEIAKLAGQVGHAVLPGHSDDVSDLV